MKSEAQNKVELSKLARRFIIGTKPITNRERELFEYIALYERLIQHYKNEISTCNEYIVAFRKEISLNRD